MANGLPSPEATPSREVKKLQKRVGKSATKGFYYHAAEYQRQAQKERGKLAKFFGAVAEPFTIHVRAFRLWNETRRKGGGGSAVLSSEFTKKALEGTLSQQDIQKFQATSRVRSVFEKYDVSPQQKSTAESVLQTVFDKKGQLSPEEMQKLEKEYGVDITDINYLNALARDNSNSYLSASEMKGKFADDAIYGSLTLDQQKLAKQVWIGSWVSTVLTGAKYTAVGLIAANPASWGLVAASTILGGTARIATLNKEGATYDISKQKGLDVAQHIGGWGRLFGVDWDKDHRVTQVFRAAGVGAALGVAAKFLGPSVLEAFHNPGAAAHHVGDVFSGSHGAAASAGAEAHGSAISTVNEHVEHFAHAAKVHFLPDTTHHDWQQLHSYIDKSGGHNAIRLDYVGQDDGGKAHFLDLMMGNGKHVFVQNDITLAVNGPHADDLINIYDAPGHVVGQIHSVNLAHELGLNQPRIDNFAKLTAEAHKNLWHGTQDASDLQTILHTRGLYNNGVNGNALYGVRIGGGYFDRHNVFQIGASNHYFNSHLLNDNPLKTDFGGLPEAEEHFRSAWANQLEGIDNVEDRGLEWLREHIFPSPVTNAVVSGVDNLTDLELRNIDFVVSQFQNDKGLFVAEALPFLLTGAAFARTKPNRLKKAAAGALTVTFPAFAAMTGLGFLLGKIRNPKKKAEQPAKQKASPETAPSGQPPAQPNTPSGTAASAAPTPATTPVASTVAADDTTVTPLTPAPPVPATPETVAATAAAEEPAGTTPPVETVASTIATEEQQAVESLSVVHDIEEYADRGDIAHMYAALNNDNITWQDLRERLLPVLATYGGQKPYMSDVQRREVMDTYLTSSDFVKYFPPDQESEEVKREGERLRSQIVPREVRDSVLEKLNSVLPRVKNELQIVQEAQNALPHATGEEQQQLQTALNSLPAGRALNVFEKEKGQKLSDDDHLQHALGAAAHGRELPNAGYEIVPLTEEDFQAIAQVLYSNSDDEHVSQVRDFYNRSQNTATTGVVAPETEPFENTAAAPSEQTTPSSAGESESSVVNEIPQSVTVPITAAEATAQAAIPPEGVESTAAVSSELPAISEEQFVADVRAIHTPLGQTLQLPEQQRDDLFYRLDDALLSGNSYIGKDSYMKEYSNRAELVDLVSKDFGVTASEQQEAIRRYIDEYQTLHDQVAYSSALRYAGQNPEKFDQNAYAIMEVNATPEAMKKLYERLSQNPTDPTLNREVDESLAIMLQLGVPFARQREIPYRDIFGTDFTYLEHLPDYGQSDQSSTRVNAIDEALNFQLISEGIPRNNQSVFEVYNGLDLQRKQELLTNAVDSLTQRYASFFTDHNQTEEGARVMLTHVLSAALENARPKQYQTLQRPFTMIEPL